MAKLSVSTTVTVLSFLAELSVERWLSAVGLVAGLTVSFNAETCLFGELFVKTALVGIGFLTCASVICVINKSGKKQHHARDVIALFSRRSVLMALLKAKVGFSA
jgi:hypothetical protein